MRASPLIAAVVMTSLLLAPGIGFAAPTKQEMAQAQKADREGQRLEKKKKFEEARAAYLQALEIHDKPDTRIRLARAEAGLGNLLEAAQQLRTVLEAKKLSFVLRAKAKAQLAKLEKLTPTLELQMPKDFSGKVWVDDEEVSPSSLREPLALNPGPHGVRAEATGYKPFSETVELEEKEKETLTVVLAEEPVTEAAPVADKEKPKEKKSSGGGNALAWVSIGIGVVGVGVGTYMGLQARSTRMDLEHNCDNDVCSESDRALYDKGKNQANIATVGFIVGGVGIGLGTILLLTGGKGKGKAKAETAAHVTPVLGPGNVGLHGAF
jgi:hypothetical protein